MKNKGFFTPFAKNLRLLIDRDGGSVNAWCAKHADSGVLQSRINRLLNGDVSGQLDTVDQVADATGYAPWQLLHPDFQPGREPPMLDAETRHVAAVFAAIKNPLDRRRALAILETFEDAAAEASKPNLPRAA